MVNAEEFKGKIVTILTQNYEIKFLGKNFDKIVSFLSETKAEKIYNWIEEVVTEEFQPILIASKKPYKDWTIKQLLTFRYPFSVNNTEYRILLVKIKNSVYIEFHLGDHKYYDKVRKELDLKR